MENSQGKDNDQLNQIKILQLCKGEILQEDTKRKRRSKKDQNGRLFSCECGKSYLSQLALNNHRKSKHDFISSDKSVSSKRGRGRPKKAGLKSLYENLNNPEIIYQNFFDNKLRNNDKNESVIIQNYIDIIFEDIYVKHKDKCNIHYISIKDHCFLNYFINPNSSIMLKHSCDFIFKQYLEYVSKLTNKDYFLLILKFIVIFRECINKYKNIELENSIYILGETIPKHVQEFTQYYDAEQAPELCNEFISDYLVANDYFGFRSDNISELIELMQHFCYWLYENNYTSSRLSLISET
jgi:hypothetical protein